MKASNIVDPVLDGSALRTGSPQQHLQTLQEAITYFEYAKFYSTTQAFQKQLTSRTTVNFSLELLAELKVRRPRSLDLRKLDRRFQLPLLCTPLLQPFLAAEANLENMLSSLNGTCSFKTETGFLPRDWF